MGIKMATGPYAAAPTVTDSTEVRGSPWAKLAASEHAMFTPTVCADLTETHFELWQRRIDLSRSGQPVTWTPHDSLRVMYALEYGTRADGVSAPCEPAHKLTFIVAGAWSFTEAGNRIRAELKAHGFNPDNWLIGGEGFGIVYALKAGEK